MPHSLAIAFCVICAVVGLGIFAWIAIQAPRQHAELKMLELEIELMRGERTVYKRKRSLPQWLAIAAGVFAVSTGVALALLLT